MNYDLYERIENPGGLKSCFVKKSRLNPSQIEKDLWRVQNKFKQEILPLFNNNSVSYRTMAKWSTLCSLYKNALIFSLKETLNGLDASRADRARININGRTYIFYCSYSRYWKLIYAPEPWDYEVTI